MSLYGRESIINSRPILYGTNKYSIKSLVCLLHIQEKVRLNCELNID